MHFLCLEPRETDKNVMKFSKNWVLKFHFLLLGTLLVYESNCCPVTVTFLTVCRRPRPLMGLCTVIY